MNYLKTITVLLLIKILFSCSKKQKNDKLQTDEPTRPNILFIMSDDHTSQSWGIYGGILKDHVKTPSIKP